MSFVALPLEIIEYILKSQCLDYVDVCKVAQVCKHLKYVVESNELWKCKFDQRWPGMVSRYDRKISHFWCDEVKYRLQCGKAVQKELEWMSSRYYSEDEISQEAFSRLAAIINQHRHGHDFVIDELSILINDMNPYVDLTKKYYAEKAIRYVQQSHMHVEWNRFLDLPQEQQLLETGAVMLAQWCQPTCSITLNNISDRLGELADEVKAELLKSHPDHPLFHRKNYFSPDIQKSFWSPDQSKKILDCINYVLYEKLSFKGNDNPYIRYVENLLINKVLALKVGIPISLCVVHSAVARRLGVVCEPVNFPVHFLLRWKEHPHSLDSKYTYIDAFNKGRYLTEDGCLSLLSGVQVDKVVFQAAAPTQVFERMARNLVEIARYHGAGVNLVNLRNALELLCLINPDDYDSRLLLCRVYMHLNINLSGVLNNLQELHAIDPLDGGILDYMLQACLKQIEDNKHTNNKTTKIIPRFRPEPDHVEFAIGMVMKHKRYNYTCVIYGWDPECAATREWKVQMGVHNLPQADKQPFYNVLVEDGSNRYAAQENLIITNEPKFINHPEVGKYFQSYCHYYFLPNAEKTDEYPCDEEVRERLLQDFAVNATS